MKKRKKKKRDLESQLSTFMLDSVVFFCCFFHWSSSVPSCAPTWVTLETGSSLLHCNHDNRIQGITMSRARRFPILDPHSTELKQKP